MSLKVVFKDKYRSKNGTQMLRYALTAATKEEQAEYLAIMCARPGANKTPDEWARDEKSNPLFFQSATFFYQNGQVPPSSGVLTLNRTKDGYFLSDPAGDGEELIDEAIEVRKARSLILAEIALGLRKPLRSRAQRTAAPADVDVKTPDSIDDIQNEVNAAAGAEVAGVENANTNGTEDLNGN